MIDAALLERRDRAGEIDPATSVSWQGDDPATSLIRLAAHIRSLAIEAQRREQLSSTQFRLLMHIGKLAGCTRAAEAARALGLSHCMITEAASVLSRRNLIERARTQQGEPMRMIPSPAGKAMAARLVAWRAPLAEHRDTKHPHCHLLVKLRGHDGRALDPRKRDLEVWRKGFAEAARAQGLMLDASPRAARGVARRGVGRAVLEARRRGKARPGQPHEPYVRAQAARHAEERDAFRIAALRLARTAEGSQPRWTNGRS